MKRRYEMAEKKSHANLIEDEDIRYYVPGPPRMDRSVFWGDDISMGRNVLPPGELVPMHSHPEDQYSLILSGECDVVCGGEEFHLTPGGICFAPSNMEHSLKMWDESEVVILDIFNIVRQSWIDPLDEK